MAAYSRPTVAHSDAILPLLEKENGNLEGQEYGGKWNVSNEFCFQCFFVLRVLPRKHLVVEKKKWRKRRCSLALSYMYARVLGLFHQMRSLKLARTFTEFNI